MVNARHTKRVKALLDDAVSRGAKVIVGGEVDESANFVAPTLLEDIPADAKIMEEEIFGPLLPIIAYDDVDEVIRKVNAEPKPLALYMWSRTQKHIDRVLEQTSSGGACVNTTVVQFIHGNLPFGGVNNSGIGNAHGHFGFKAFSHERAVVRPQISLVSFFFPPYTDKVKKMIRMLLKFV